MADFREEIDALQTKYTTDELKDILAERTGERTTSVNPLTETLFQHIAPNHQPIEYAQKAKTYSNEMSRVGKNATALKMLLHEQVGRPLYEPIERLVKQDFAECIAAIDAHEEGYERGMGCHVPTTLPAEVDSFVPNPPARNQTPESPFNVVTELDVEHEIQITQSVDQHLGDTNSPFFVYVLDCTPSVDEEDYTKLWDRRRAVQTKIEASIPLSELEPKEQATHALNRSKRVYYVGSTNDVSKRVQEHIAGTDKSGVSFTNTIPPRDLVKVEGCSSRKKAESLEGALAKKLNRRDGLFAYSDEM